MSAPTLREFRPGQFLFHEGTPSDCMYLIKRGTVGVRKRKGPAWVEIARVYSSEVLGELSFFDRQPRSASAIALTEVEAMEIKFDSLDKIWTGVPDYMKTIIASVADRLRKANDTIRRLQKDVIVEPGKGPLTSEAPSASDVMAALESNDAAAGNDPESGGDGSGEGEKS